MVEIINTPPKRKSYSLEAIDELGLQDFVLDLDKNGNSASEISLKLKTDKSTEISPSTITKWLKDRKASFVAKQVIVDNDKYELMVDNYKTELNSILEEVKTVKSQALTDKDLVIYDKLVGRIYQGIELLAKLSGAMSDQKIDVNIVINELNRQGYDKFKPARGELFGKKPRIIDVDAIIKDDDDKEIERINKNE